MRTSFVGRRTGFALLGLALSCSSSGSRDTDSTPSAGGSAAGGAAGSFELARGGTVQGSSGASSRSGGTPGFGGTTGGLPSSTAVAGYPAMVPPPAQADGSSPYLRPCHGDTASCVDVANLRCLGIRDNTDVQGYSCSNPCNDDPDCSSAPSLTAAKAECVDFTTQKHCLLVCLENGEQRACPTGMTCYNYPGNPLGYCLWK